MSKILIVHYLPRGERSNTRKILDSFRAAVAGKATVTEHNLIADTPPLLLRDNLLAYIFRDYLHQATPAQAALLAPADALIAELQAADVVVLAFPVYNFSLPAVVKAWFDQVLLKGHTWDMDAMGKYIGLLKGKSLVITTSGGETPPAGHEHAISLAKELLEFTGLTTESIGVGGVNAGAPEEVAARLAAAEKAAADFGAELLK